MLLNWKRIFQRRKLNRMLSDGMPYCTDTQDVIDARNNMLANRVMGVVFSSTLQTFIDQGLSLCSEQACILDNLIYDCAMQDKKLTDLYHITCELQDILNEGIEI